MSCKDCIHYEICEIMSDQYGISKVSPSQCGYYKNTADVEEVRHGEYIQKGAWHIECSVCGNVLAHIGEVKNYCPNCGAKMGGERREE